MSESNFASIEVLIVDDDDYQRKVLKKMLAVIGIEKINQAASVAAALEIATELRENLHVVISDLDMPDVDGMEFLRLLSERKFTGSIIIVSAKNEGILRSVELMAKEYGLSLLGVLPKPATVPALRDKFAAYLQRPRASVRAGTSAISVEDVSKGLELDQFEPFFQPKVELNSRRVIGAEALARWRHPERGILPPGMFIGLAEQHGLIDQLTWAILEKSAAQIRHWSDAGLDVSVSVNFSQTSLADTRLSNRVVDVISRHSVPPEKLIIEVTETVVMTDVARCLETLSRLRMKGFGLSIDDFGTGHSSLQQLSRVPYTELKIDQAFVTGASTQPHLLAVLESNASMAKKLGLKVVGEGVETLDDWNCLRQVGCEIAQGYYIAKPMEGERFLNWVRNWEGRESVLSG